MQNWQQTIISQYANSKVITALIGYLNSALDPSTNINNWYNWIWNVNTAQGYGLDVWGRIVGVNRVLTVTSGKFFGYTGPGALGASGTPYNTNVYYNGVSGTQNYVLGDAAFRTLIFAKALANISNNSVPAINAILMTLFGTGNGSGTPTQPAAYCTDPQGMAMTYTFSFAPTPIQLAIISSSGVLPRPSGVALTVSHP